ncbi:hypothetical protein [Nitrosomonas communis]|uniref:hypothetical protein n=1 Tax=Nitrosomonas communis TaxID=44574 RepID=UPI0011E7C20B|nr:hypothetical protein [Nitrosomonas communis]
MSAAHLRVMFGGNEKSNESYISSATLYHNVNGDEQTLLDKFFPTQLIPLAFADAGEIGRIFPFLLRANS